MVFKSQNQWKPLKEYGLLAKYLQRQRGLMKWQRLCNTCWAAAINFKIWVENCFTYSWKGWNMCIHKRGLLEGN